MSDDCATIQKRPEGEAFSRLRRATAHGTLPHACILPVINRRCVLPDASGGGLGYVRGRWKHIVEKPAAAPHRGEYDATRAHHLRPGPDLGRLGSPRADLCADRQRAAEPLD